MSPRQLFELFWDEELLQLIETEIVKYALFKNAADPKITVDELKVFIGIMILSGFNLRNSRFDYWSSSEVMRCDAVIKAMRRDRFTEIMRFFHVKDNTELDREDKYTKIRPLLSHVKSKFMQHFVPDGSHLSIDEMMIEYFGRSNLKQAHRIKPIRFGYEVFGLCTPEGYLIALSLYQCKIYEGNAAYNQTYGKSAATVLHLLDQLQDDLKSLPFHIYIDRRFTSLPLFFELEKRGYAATGTIMDNRLNKCPLMSAEYTKKKVRGYYSCCHGTDKSEGNQVNVIRWRNNGPLTVASTTHGLEPLRKVERYSRTEKKKVEIDMPNMVYMYNRKMGGVDRVNQNLESLRTSIRGKKFYFPIVTWLLNAAMNNAWLLHRKSRGTGVLRYKDFAREISEYYLLSFGKPALGPGRLVNVVDDVRFDGKGHFVSWHRKADGDIGQVRCANCEGRPKTECIKCKRGLCVACFVEYHTIRQKT